MICRYAILSGICALGALVCIPTLAQADSATGLSVSKQSYTDSIEIGPREQLPYKFEYTSKTAITSGNLDIVDPRNLSSGRSFAGSLGISYDPGRLGLSMKALHGKQPYDSRRSGFQSAIAHENVKKNYADVELKAAYTLNKNIKPYVALSAGTNNYEQHDISTRHFSEKKGDSRNVGMLAGLQFVYKGFVEGFLAVGYEQRNYRDETLDSIENIKISSGLTWNMNKKASLKLGLQRFSAEDTQTLQGSVITRSRLEFDYNVFHNLFYSAYIDYSFADYYHLSQERDYVTAGTGLRYQLQDDISLSGDYNFEGKDSTLLGLDEDRHEFLLKLNTRF